VTVMSPLSEFSIGTTAKPIESARARFNASGIVVV
jgi:hypothetical protein